MSGLRISRLSALLALVILSLQAGPLRAVTFHVAPDGSDQWTGRLDRPNAQRTDGPLASLQGARDAVRRWKKQPAAAEPIRVIVAAGTYRLAAAVVFQPEDSGTLQRPIVYEAAPGARPVFSGGRPIQGFQPGPDGIWSARVPEVAQGKRRFEQLYVNGRRATRARTPNEFYYYVRGKVDTGVDPLTGKVENLASRAFKANPKDIAPLAALPKERLSDVMVMAYHSWEVSLHRVASVDPKTGLVVTTGNAPWPFLSWGSGQRYHLENFKAALDAPGEWFLDRDGTLYYKPLRGEDMSRAEVTAPAVSGLVRFEGNPEKGQFVEHLAIKGLALVHDAYVLPPQGHADGQAAITAPTTILADGARNIAIEDCEIAHLGGYAIWFHRACRDCRIVRNYIHDTGAGGVRIGEGWESPQPNPASATERITVDNNIIRSGGRLFPGCVGVWVGHSSYNQVTHNDIADLRYSGISVGWRWGYGDVPSVRNTISFNHIHHLGWDVLTDMGGIYTLGEARGTVISHNVVHDLETQNGDSLHGLYTDNSSSYILLENNLVYNVPHGYAYQLTSGRANTVRNNIFVTDKGGQLSLAFFYEKEEHLAVTLERNIVYGTGATLFVEGGAGRKYRSVCRDRPRSDTIASGLPLRQVNLWGIV